jgi:hypothetical protein
MYQLEPCRLVGESRKAGHAPPLYFLLTYPQSMNNAWHIIRPAW